MSILRKQFLAGTAAVAGAAAMPAIAMASHTAHPFLAADLIEAFKTVASVNSSGRYGGGYKPYYFFPNLPNQGSSHTGGFPRWERIVVGKDEASGRWLAAIPMSCGGSAGVTLTAVFADASDGPSFLGVIRGYKQGVFFENGAMHAVSAHLLAGDCNARPSRYHIGRYRVDGDSLALEQESLIHAIALHDRAGTLAGQTLFDIADVVPDGQRPHSHAVA
jgi:hypothetical protein